MPGSGQLRGLQLQRYDNPLQSNTMWEDFTVGVNQLEFSTLAVGGFGTCTFTLNGAYIDLLRWVNPYNTAMTDRIVIYDPAAVLVWEGYVFQTDLVVNETNWSISMQNLFNNVIIEYENPGRQTTQSGDTVSQGQFGIKEFHSKLGRATRASAQAMGQRILNENKALQHGKETGVSGTTYGRTMRVTCYGYWSTLGWRIWNRAFKQTADIAGITKDVLTKKGQYISTDQSNILATGTVVDRDQPENTPALDYLRKLVDYGDSSNRRLLAGVYENRVFFLNSRPTTVKYFTDLGGNEVYDAYGKIVPLYAVRAGNYIRFRNLSPDINIYTDPNLDPQVSFIEEATYQADNDSLRIRPSGSVSTSLWVGRLVHGQHALKV